MLYDLASGLVERLLAGSFRVVTAESCTAGLVASTIAEVPGASKVFWGAYVCYDPEAKISMLGVDRKRLEAFGAVSRETAAAMAEGALARSDADVAVAVTGLAGPQGDGSDVPVGTVWLALRAKNGRESTERLFFSGDRNSIRRAAAEAALSAARRIIT